MKSTTYAPQLAVTAADARPCASVVSVVTATCSTAIARMRDLIDAGFVGNGTPVVLAASTTGWLPQHQMKRRTRLLGVRLT
jgi:hypothetical protein